MKVAAPCNVPQTGVIDFLAIANALAADVRAEGGDVMLAREVEKAVPSCGRWTTSA